MDQSPSIKKKTTDGLLWNTTERFASKAFQFVFSVLIARILVPEYYGLIAIANLCVSLSDVIVDSGFSKALLRKSDKSENDYATVFWFNLVTSCVVYSLLWLFAPLIGAYYDSPELGSIVRVFSLSIILNAVCGIQKLRLISDLDFRKIAVFEISAVLLSGVIAYILALRGAGVWALVYQGLSCALIRVLLFWVNLKWKPSRISSWDTMKEFFSFGSKLLLSEYVGRIYTAVCALFIGKKYSTETLGLYGKSDAFASAPSGIIAGSINSVTYPVIAGIQDDDERMGRSFCTMTGLSAFLVFPLMAGLAVLSDDLIPFLLTDKWVPMVPIFKVLCFSYIFVTLGAIPQNYLLVRGKSGLFFRIQLASRLVGLALLYPLSFLSVEAVCAGIGFCYLLNCILMLCAVRKEIKFSFIQLIADILPSVLFSAIMYVAVYFSMGLVHGHLAAIGTGLFAGVTCYLGLALLTRNKNIGQAAALLKPYLRKH